MKTVYHVNVNYLSKDYDNRALEFSSPFGSICDAEIAYHNACKEHCVDDKNKPARVTLEKTFFPAPDAWGKTTEIKRNF